MDYGLYGQSNAADLKQTAFQSLELDHIKKESRRRENHMTAEVSRGHLEYHDERGSYRIPVGRRGRKCLAILDKREGEYVRSLEMDLFTGFVYYCVDNATTGGLSYYYDMSSKKVSHYFIHRYLRNAMNRGFKATPLELEVFEKLPCDNWVEEMERLPGWKEAIERIDFVMEMYGIDINAFTALDYQKCCRHLGGKTAFYRFIHDAVCYEFDDYPICFVCQNCRTNRHGERHCTTCFVPVGETSSTTKTLKLSDDYPISSDIIDLVEAMPHNECSSFIPRTNELGTKIVDWLDKMREKV